MNKRNPGQRLLPGFLVSAAGEECRHVILPAFARAAGNSAVFISEGGSAVGFGNQALAVAGVVVGLVAEVAGSAVKVASGVVKLHHVGGFFCLSPL